MGGSLGPDHWALQEPGGSCRCLSVPQVTSHSKEPRGFSEGTDCQLPKTSAQAWFPSRWTLTASIYERLCLVNICRSDKRRRQTWICLEPLLRFLVLDLHYFPQMPLNLWMSTPAVQVWEASLSTGHLSDPRVWNAPHCGCFGMRSSCLLVPKQISNIEEQLMTSLSFYLWWKKKSGQDFGLNENFVATEGYFSL